MKQHEHGPGRRARALVRAGLLAAAWLASSAAWPAQAAEACARLDAAQLRTPTEASPQRAAIEERLGIRILGLRRSSAGYMLDFRYRLIDPVKAAVLLDRKVAPALVDQASGAELRVPDAPKVGQLRPTSRNNVIAGRQYFILFANPGRLLGAGSKVTLVAGDAEIADLVVE